MSTIEPTESPIELEARFRALRARYLARSELAREGKHIQPGLSEEARSEAVAAFEAETAQLIQEQLSIIARLRRTATGPAKAGGKRAKKAPIDLAALANDLMAD